jgi:hypothetical protein
VGLRGLLGVVSERGPLGVASAARRAAGVLSGTLGFWVRFAGIVAGPLALGLLVTRVIQAPGEARWAKPFLG